MKMVVDELFSGKHCNQADEEVCSMQSACSGNI